MLVAIVFMLLVVGSIAFHLWSPSVGWWFLPRASHWDQIDLTLDIIVLFIELFSKLHLILLKYFSIFIFFRLNFINTPFVETNGLLYISL